MSPRPRTAFALAFATTLAGTPSLPAAAQEPEEPLVEQCYIEGLTDAEAAAGETSDIWCEEVPEDALAQRDSLVLARLYNSADGSGIPYTLEGTTCNGVNISLGGGNPFDNIISSTELVLCGYAKHWSNANYTGSNQLLSGTGFHTMNATMNNATSSIEYAP